MHAFGGFSVLVSIFSLIISTTTTNRNLDSDLPPTLYYNIPNSDDGERIAYIHHKPTANQLQISKKRSKFKNDEEGYRQPLNDGNSSYINNGRTGIVFLPGFNSRMRSTKSKALFNYCQQTNREFITLDYYGHGESSGGIGDGDTGPGGTIERWTNDVLMILNHLKPSRKQTFVGSSMGSWIMILLYNILSSSKSSLSFRSTGTSASAKHDYNMMISGLVGLASAPDFTKLLSEQIDMNTKLFNQMNQLGYCDISTKYDQGGSYRIYKELLLDGEKHYLLPSSTTTTKKKSQSSMKHQRLARSHIIDVPVVLIHGMEDDDINWKYSEQLLQCIDCRKEKKLILRKNGDHRLSSKEDIDVILRVIDKFL